MTEHNSPHSGPAFSDGDLSRSLEAYLDDQLSTEDRARFEHDVAHDPALRKSVERQRSLDHSLRRIFAAPALCPLPAHLINTEHNGHGKTAHRGNPISHPAAKRSIWRKEISIRAAAITLLALLLTPALIWKTWQYYWVPTTEVTFALPQPLDLAYNSEIAAGFQPISSCNAPVTTDPIDTVARNRFGQTIAMQQLPDNIKMVGISFDYVISPNTAAVLFKVWDRPVIVFVESADRDPGQKLTQANPNLHLYKRRLGSVVLYEVSPLSKPSAIELFYAP